MRKIYITLLAALLLTLCSTTDQVEILLPQSNEHTTKPAKLKECTTAIISGEVTPDGRPLLWKNRDTDNPDQEFAHFDDGDFSYIAVINAGEIDQTFGGVNSAGFAIENSYADNFLDTLDGPDDDGFIIKLALQTCRTIDDLIAILDSTNESGRTYPTSFGVIDAVGGAAIIECSAYEYTMFDPANENDAPDGFLVRATFAYSGEDEAHFAQWRHDHAYEMIRAGIESREISPEYLLSVVAPDIVIEEIDPYPLPYRDFCPDRNFPIGIIPTYQAINRNVTRSALVIQGVHPDEDPLLTTMFAIVGQPIATTPLPLWVHSGSTPDLLDGEETSLLCDLANSITDQIYDSDIGIDALNTFQLANDNGNGLLTVTTPIIETILQRTRAAMLEWRDALPEPGEMAAFQDEQAEFALEFLSIWERPTTRHVPENYETVQDAVNASSNGDTVLVEPGIHVGPVEFNGRSVVVGSRFLTTGNQDFIASTIIDCEGNDRSVVVFRRRENENSGLTGLTLQNASTGYGGGIYCNAARPRLSYLLIRNNEAERSGGGIYCTQGSNPTLDHVTLVGNYAGTGGGIHCPDTTSTPIIVNSIIRGNEPPALPNWLDIIFSNVENGFDGEGNIDADPIFVDPDNLDFRIGWESFPEQDETCSPCIDTGDPRSPPDPDGSRTDMGAFFFNQDGGERELVVNLIEGWNLISINVRPPEELWIREEGPDVIRMTEQLRIDDENHRVDIFKDEDGLFYLPTWGFCNIQYWDLADGYQLKITEDFEAAWGGDPIPANADIPLAEGWNLIAYYPTYELDASAPNFYVLSNVIDNILIAKDAFGNFLFPEFQFSNMEPWRESQGYQVKTDADVILNYPEEQQRDHVRSNPNPSHQCPQEAKRTNSNMSLLVNSIPDKYRKSETQLIAFTTDGIIVGSGIIDPAGRCGMAIWGDDHTTDVIDGMIENEAFIIRIVNGSHEILVDSKDVEFLRGDRFEYHKDGIIVVNIVDKAASVDKIELVGNYPNPFNAETKISLYLPRQTHVSVSIYDLSGRLVTQLTDHEMIAGKHDLSWNASSESTGIYIMRVKSNEFCTISKLVIMR